MKARELRLVELTDNGTRLVLVSDAGEEFTLPVDAKLRAALRGDHARTGQLEIKMESALRPRDIQARIRAGESPESVADAAQTSVDRIMGFAMPVLAERAHIAERAQRASVRRKGGEGSSRVLGDAVAERLRSQNVDPTTVEWDAWRREDGRWTLVADFHVGGEARHAEFLFDAPGRYVMTEDDEARWLVGEQVASSPSPSAAPPVTATDGSGRRLTAVSSDEELPLGEDALGLVAEAGRADAGAEEATVDLTTTARAVRSGEEQDPGPRRSGDSWMATQATDRPAPGKRPEAAEEPETAPAAAETAAETPAETPAETLGTDADEQPAEQEQEKPARRPARKKGRASVPSWDEIMFGGGRQE